MDKKYIIKVTKEDPWPYYITEVHAGYTNMDNHKASLSYKTITAKNYAMRFNTVEEVKMVWEFVNMYNKIHHKDYKIEMEEYEE